MSLLLRVDTHIARFAPSSQSCTSTLAAPSPDVRRIFGDAAFAVGACAAHPARSRDGVPGYNSVIGKDNVTIGGILLDNGYRMSWFGKDHNTPVWVASQAGLFDQWPTGSASSTSTVLSEHTLLGSGFDFGLGARQIGAIPRHHGPLHDVESHKSYPVPAVGSLPPTNVMSGQR